MVEKTVKDLHLETPRTGAEEHAEKRDRTSELPATASQEDLEKANSIVNQNVDDKGVEVQDKLAVPHGKVHKRGQTKWTDKDGTIHKELDGTELEYRSEKETPDYLKLHEEVLEGKDPLEATLAYQDKRND